MVMKKDGSVWATGSNEYGQLGDGTTDHKNEFIRVIDKGAVDIAAGSDHSMVLKIDGSVWATGYNEYGQLGDGSTISTEVFEQVLSDGTSAVAAGAFHSMLLKEDGTIWATGSNQYGQFGDGSIISAKHFVRLALFGNGADTARLHTTFSWPRNVVNLPFYIFCALYLAYFLRVSFLQVVCRFNIS